MYEDFYGISKAILSIEDSLQTWSGNFSIAWHVLSEDERVHELLGTLTVTAHNYYQ